MSRRTIVITGASAGVGRATARRFAREGARVGLIARGREALENTKKEIEDLGGQALVLPLDVANADQLEIAAEQIEKSFGPIDVWVNNAMVSVFSEVKDMQPDEYKRVTEVTYLGAVYGTLAALRRMLPRNRGMILQVGSALTYRGIPLQSAYCGAKHALMGFTESLRCELLHERSQVHLSIVHLPAVNTPQFDWSKSRMGGPPRPLGTIFQPEIAADAIHWASNHDRREWYVGVPTVKAIWGDRIAPALLDHYLARIGYTQEASKNFPETKCENLWHPCPGDYGAHGRFDEEAKSWSPQWTYTKYRPWIIGAIAAGVIFGYEKYRRD